MHPQPVAPLVLIMFLSASGSIAQDPYADRRDALIGEIQRNIRETQAYTGRETFDDAVMDAIRSVPRHEFVPDALRSEAWDNRPLSIGEGQTISQPYIVALMTQLAGVSADSKVLEVGTGSGYQAAVLATIVDRVYTIEIVQSLGVRAGATLERLGYTNVDVRIGDGYLGWPDQAPFDAIVVTAAPEEVPQPLIDQIAPGGRLVIPVGGQGETQSLRVLEKDESGEIQTRDVLPVLFVPFTRDN